MLRISIGGRAGRRAAIVAAAMTTTAGAAGAQSLATTADTVGADDILVLGKSYGQPVGKLVTALKDVPNTVTVVQQDQIRAQNLFTLEDALTAVTGVTVTGEGSEDPQYLSRGFEINNFLVDGVASRALAFPVPVPDLFFYDRVEVLRGPAGLFNGAGSPAGSLNLVRKRPTRAASLGLFAGYGRFDNRRFTADGSVPIGDAAGIRAGGLYQGDDQFFDGNGRKRYGGFVNGELRLGERTTVSAGASYDLLKPSTQSGLPGFQGGDDGSDGRLLDVPRSTYLGGDWNRGRYRTWNAFAELVHRPTDDVVLKATGLLLDLDRTDRYTLIPFSPLTAVSPANAGNIPVSGARGDYGVRAYAVDLNGVAGFEALGQRQTLIVGVDYQSRAQRLNSASRPAYARINVFDPVSPPEPPLDPYTPLPPFNGTRQLVFGNRVEVNQYGAYGQVRLTPVARVTLIGGGRVTFVDSATQTVVPFVGEPERDKVQGRFTPYAGAVVDVTDTLNLYASYTDSFEPQTAFAPRADGRAIAPLVGTQYEAGSKLGLFGGRLLLSAAAYQIKQRNRLFEDPSQPDVVFQIGRVRSRGVEAEAQGEILPGWRVNAGYAYTRFRYLEETDPSLDGTSFLPAIPRHSIKGFTNYAPVDGPLARFSLGGGATWFSGTSNGLPAAFGDTGALVRRSTIVRQGGYAVVTLRAGWKVTDRLQVTVNADNLLDRNYYARISSTRRGNFYGAPRTVFAALRYDIR